ncbi:hypothetical protein Hdeb2414_s0448g00895941 [Helianthus debilis subsp. tardiflorus]
MGCFGLGLNRFGSKRVRVRTGFGSGRLENAFKNKNRLYIKGQFCRVETGPGRFGLSTGQCLLYIRREVTPSVVKSSQGAARSDEAM